jgi:hypothetical protein
MPAQAVRRSAFITAVIYGFRKVLGTIKDWQNEKSNPTILQSHYHRKIHMLGSPFFPAVEFLVVRHRL